MWLGINMLKKGHTFNPKNRKDIEKRYNDLFFWGWLYQFVNKGKAKRDTLLKDKRQLEQQILEQEESVEGKNRKIADLDNQLKELRQKFYDVFDTKFEFDPNDAICPTCKRPAENMEEKQEKMRKDFNRDKSHKLEKIKAEGNSLKEEKERLEAQVNQGQGDLKQAKSKTLNIM